MASQLLPIENVTPMMSSVIRILGGNPGKFTLQGTNTYLISRPIQKDDHSSNQPVNCILVDTGEGKETFTSLLSSILQGKDQNAGSCKRVITDIILTHWHHDHIGGLPSILRLLKDLNQKPPKIHKYLSDTLDQHIFDLLKSIEGENLIEKSISNQSLLHPLHDGEIIQTKSDSTDSNSLRSLQVIHSPGHTSDHICLLIKEDGVLLTGDHVLGQGTSVFENLGEYLRSLKKCKEILQKQQPQQNSISESDSSIGNLYPAHGPILKDGINVLQQYRDHRLEREQQVLQLLRQPSPSNSSQESSVPNGWTIPDLVSNLYKDYPENLYPAAARGIFLHLHKLAMPDPDLENPKEGQKVFCQKGSSSDLVQIPEIPKEDHSWLQVMDLRWCLSDKDGGSLGAL